ncbi:MAG: hypothetical protein ACPF9D_02810 [Owenweeksia sp.]
MNPILRNILAVIAGWVGGGIVNYALVIAGHSIFPMEGVDPNDMEALGNFLSGAEGEYFIFPFLAHAVGTLVGALIAAAIAATRKMMCAIIIGVLFLIGGIMASYMIPAPTWFIVLDLVVAYIPMAWIGGKLAGRKS